MTKTEIPAEMRAVVTRGEGGYDQLDYCTVPVPDLKSGEVLVKVGAAGVNNTEINTRMGWYARSVTTGTIEGESLNNAADGSGGWSETTPFPLIQGTDCCGIVVASRDETDAGFIGERVLIRACMRPDGFDSFENTWMASNFDGAFAEYVAVPASEVFPVHCNWSDAELATIPCAYATAETMLERTRCAAGMRVLVSGASGGVGSATIQLAKRRGAEIIAITSPAKREALRALGCTEIYDRDDDITALLADNLVDIAIDNVAGPGFGQILNCLKRGGRYASSGAIAGPVVALDMRDLYLKDISIFGSTAWDEAVFPNLIRYIEAGEIKPLVDKIFPLSDIVDAQKYFSTKQHIGNVVLIP